MKKFLQIVAISTTLVIFSTTSAFAQNPSTNRQEIKEKVQEKKQNTKERIQNKRENLASRAAEKKDELRSRRLAKIKNRLTKIIERMNRRMQRLENIVGRIQRRIDRLKARGVDVTKPQNDLSACGAQKASALGAISAAQGTTNSLDVNSSTRENVQAGVQALKRARDAIHAYRKCLVAVTTQLRSFPKIKEATPSGN